MAESRVKGYLAPPLRHPAAVLESTSAQARKDVPRTEVWSGQSGPFAGMSCISEAICSSLVPKLLGSYESELHQVLNQILETDYQNVIDIGCAEGYYAVGLALRLPNARVYAWMWIHELETFV